jgi:hypothetical protein
MKNVLFIFCVTGFLLTGVIPARAGVAVGATTWYAGWNNSPSFYDKANPFLLYGPVFSVDVADKWSVAGVFLTGQMSWKNKNGGTKSYEQRYDSDLTINYIFSRYVKFFGGAKYMYYTRNHNEEKIPLSEKGGGDHLAPGPTLGGRYQYLDIHYKGYSGKNATPHSTA